MKAKRNPFVSKNGKVNEDAFARHLIIKYDFKTIYGEKSDELYASDGQIYRTEKAREIIKTECEKRLFQFCKTRNVNEIYEKIKRLTAVDRKVFDEIPEKLIPLSDCIFNIETKKPIRYNPRFPFRFLIPVKYDKDAVCPMFLKFLEETLLPEDIPVMQEWFGFNLYRRYFIKKGVICVGEKDCGKTILLKVLTKFLGMENTCGVSLQKITAEDRFSLCALYTKHANIYDDLSSQDMKNSGGFKIATGGGYMTGEQKFGDQFTFLNYSKQTFACNKIPWIKDDDDAYTDRWMPIEFLNQVPKEQQDNFLIDKLTSPQELSGIFNWSIEGLLRLLKNGKFSYTRTKEQIKNIMERSGNVLKRFADDCLTENQGKKITRDAMFEIYTFWANQTNSPRISKEQLGRRLEASVRYIMDKRDNKKRYWEGVSVNWESKFFLNLKSVCETNKLDTLDTLFLTIIDKYNSNSFDSNTDGLDVLFLKASIVSKEGKQETKPSDTLDTISKKEIDTLVIEDIERREERKENSDEDLEVF